MSVVTDPREAAYFERRKQVDAINVKRAAAGLSPVAVGMSLDSGVETMAYVERDVPWHVDPGKDIPGTKVAIANAFTTEEGIVKAGLDWEAIIGELWGGPNHQESRLVDDKVAVYRSTDGKVLGVTGLKYKPIQNREVFGFLDSLVADGIMHFETAGSLYGGKSVWILAKMEEDWSITLPSGEDHHSTFLGAVTTHDGSGKLKIFQTDVRIVCKNTTRLALAGSDFTVAVAHKGDVKANLTAAKKVLSVTTAAQRRYVEWLQQLANTEVSQDNVDAVQDGMFGSADDEEERSTRKENMIQRFLDIYHAESERDGSTGIALFNSVTGYATHSVGIRKQEDGTEGMTSLLNGSTRWYTKLGLEALQETTGLTLQPV
jgi:phage/plasmid-like protein (TIGR03299 family)